MLAQASHCAPPVPNGAITYISSGDFAESFFTKLAELSFKTTDADLFDTMPIDAPCAVATRSESLGLALEVHCALDCISGLRHRNFGTTIHDAKSKLSPDLVHAVRRLQ